MTNAAELLIDHALALEWETLSDSTRTAAATFLHDSVVVGIAGRRAPYANEVMTAVRSWGLPAGKEGARVLGRPGLRLPPSSAAFLNAFQIHAQEFDCVHEPAVVHPLATILSALLAEADRSGPYDGQRLLTALVAGVDVAAGLGVAATSPVKFFRPATAGIFGCVAALARLRKMPRGEALDALGLALAYASGTMQAHVEGKATLPLQIAGAARSAVQAIDLALAGLPGPSASIDGPYGYLTLFESSHDIQRLMEGLAGPHRIEQVSWKPFPTGRAAHGAIVATQRLMHQHGLHALNLETLTYRAPPLIVRLVGRPLVPDMTPAYARLCFPYLGAVVLTRGTVDLSDFTAERLNDPTIAQLASRISVESDGNPDPAAFVPARAEALLTDGRALSQEVTVQFGAPAWPLTREEHLEKARRCLAFAGLEGAHQKLADACLAMAGAADATAGLWAAQEAGGS
ncbi:MmgE/PrpD family protein [Nitrospirillum pindoramense]|uniref:2-methylcitrate dehydratase PrpD n=1 Tax=Nitrospirillum amazonense TaxID=28077 RepID=A0A560HHF3_9PROT|nr:MmgE/PrpD family protein [Nitrospirillum amazonense]TWB45882.1 2-methylcitrate dehydratase PrpD [Nitrospirillum amazonense]